ncbi:MAG: hypothetical protein ACXAEU_14705 [Candidatus Hodarchaeales archaeon]|jgi:23S rRNA maturation-related 3'-5' exoribonuclease YhaM
MKPLLDPATIEEVETCIKQSLKVKDVTVLPVYQGFLVFCKAKPSFIVWMHKSMVEGLALTVLDVARQFSEDAFFDLLTGGFILKKAYKSVFPDPPVGTAFFYPHTHVLQIGELVVVKEGTIAGAVDSMTQLTTGVLKAGLSAGKSVTDMLKTSIGSSASPREEIYQSDKETEIQMKRDEKVDEGIKLIYLRFQDRIRMQLRTKLEKENLKPDQAIKTIQKLIQPDEKMDFNAAAGNMLDKFLHVLHKGDFTIETLDIKKKFLPI